MNRDGTNPRRLTANTSGDAFPTLSPDGNKIVFDSNRNRAATEPLNTSDLVLMNTDGSEQTWLIRAGLPTWAPDSKQIAFHRSASGTGLPILPFPCPDRDAIPCSITPAEPPRSEPQPDPQPQEVEQ